MPGANISGRFVKQEQWECCMASQADIGVCVQAPGAFLRRHGSITQEKFRDCRPYMQNPTIECIFGRKMVRYVNVSINLYSTIIAQCL